MSCEEFYTLPRQIDNHRIVWQPNPKLKASIDDLCQKMGEMEAESLVEKIARYLLRRLQEQPDNLLITRHWQAFLLHRTEKVAKKIFSILPTHIQSHSYLDLFQMGALIVNNPSEFLSNFDESCRDFNYNYWYPSFKSFCHSKIKNSLFSEVRKISGCSTLGRTNLGLVVLSSQTQVRRALSYKYSAETVSQYLLIWKCFQEVRQSVDLPINLWNLEHFQLVADHDKLLSYSLTEDKIKQILEEIGEAIRHLLDPSSISLDDFLSGLDHDSRTLLDILPDELITTEEPGLDEEMRARVESFKIFFSNLLDELSVSKQQIGFLRYGLNFRQHQIGNELALPAHSISYQLNCLKKQLLTPILDWGGNDISSLPNAEIIDQFEHLLRECYENKINQIFSEIIQLLRHEDEEKFNLLRDFYIGSKTTVEITEIWSLIETNKQQLIVQSLETIKTEIILEFEHPEIVKQKLLVILEDKLLSLLS